MAPVVFRFESLKFKINANDHNPPHVHVEGKGATVRINLETLDFMDDRTEFDNGTLQEILAQVIVRQDELKKEWEKYHENE